MPQPRTLLDRRAYNQNRKGIGKDGTCSRKRKERGKAEAKKGEGKNGKCKILASGQPFGKESSITLSTTLDPTMKFVLNCVLEFALKFLLHESLPYPYCTHTILLLDPTQSWENACSRFYAQ